MSQHQAKENELVEQVIERRLEQTRQILIEKAKQYAHNGLLEEGLGIAQGLNNSSEAIKLLKEVVPILEANATSIETYTRIVGKAKELISEYEVSNEN